LLLRRYLEHAEFLVRIAERREYLAMDAEIRMVHVAGFDGIGHAQGDLTKVFARHDRPTIRAFVPLVLRSNDSSQGRAEVADKKTA
jgi:hypothetical protein